MVTTLRSEIVARRSKPLDTHDPEEIADLLHRMTTGFQEGLPRLAGIGIGVGGNVTHRATVVVNAFLGWEEVPLAYMVEGRTGLPVVDSNVAALIEAEAWFGAGRGLDRFAVLTIGAGIGYGLMLGGRLVRTGEDGHGVGKRWIINPNGPLTPEGERGSAMALLTIPGISYQVRAATGRDVTYEEILAAAASGDPLCYRVIGEAARALGTLVAQIANFAMPEKVLLAGEGVSLADVAGGVVHEAILANRNPMAVPVRPETKVSDFHEWDRGAAVLAIQVLGTNEG